MAIPKPSDAALVVTHYEDGRMKVTLHGKPIPGVVGAEVKQEGKDRAVLHLSIIGPAYRLETSPLRRGEDKGQVEVIKTSDHPLDF
jgi:hypothetical protein